MDDDVQKLADLFQKLMKMLVDSPDDLKLTVIPESAGVIFRVKVAERDVGMLIGKDGRIARALRVLLLAFGRKAKTQINLDIAGSQRKSVTGHEFS